MVVLSPLELPGSPVAQGSLATVVYTWNPVTTGDLAPGETPTSPTVTVLEYDPVYPVDTLDVTSTACAGGASIVDGAVTYTITALTASYEYRALLTVDGTSPHVAERYQRIRCPQ